jgi:ABC-2 type transport system ATP-binding protein
MTDTVIHTEDLTCRFGSVQAVDHLSIDVPKGMIFGFLGPNGAGKTTTIRLLLGLLEPADGRADVLGLDVRTRGNTIREQCGLLTEHPGLYERLSAADNLEFYGRVWRLEAGQRRDRIHELLTHLGLWERRQDRVATWSRGMRQKLAVARALLHRPSLVFLDEPTAGLDPAAAAALREDLAALAAHDGMTVFLNTHNLAEAEKLCGLVGVIRAGRLVAVGSPDDLRARGSRPRLEVIGRRLDGALGVLRERPEVTSVTLNGNRLLVDLSGAVDTAPLVALMIRAGAEVEEVHKDRASLEEVFLTLTEEEA